MKKEIAVKRWYGLICVVFVLCMFCMPAEAEYMNPNNEYRSYKEDLKKKKKKETIFEKNDLLYINGKSVFLLNNPHYENCYWYICDFWKNDRYKEIAVLFYPWKFNIYRYKNNKLVKFSGGDGKKDLFNYMFYNIFIDVPGDGTLHIDQMLYNENSAQCIKYVPTVFNVSKGRIKIDCDRVYDIDYGAPEYFKKYKSTFYLKTKGKKTSVFQFPRTFQNKRLFTLKNGVKYLPLRVKFSPKYTFVEIKVVNSIRKGMTGWIGLKTNSINQGKYTYYEFYHRVRNEK